MSSARILLLLGSVALVAAVAAVAIGSVAIPPFDVARIVLGSHGRHSGWETIVWSVRLPRTVTAAFAGAALGLAGLEMQTLFRNPLADPSILGVTAGASLGVAVLVLGANATGLSLLQNLGHVGNLGLAGAGAIGAAAVLSLVLFAARRIPGRVTVLIIGVMVGYVAAALVSVLTHFSSLEAIRNFQAWSEGGFRGTTWGQLRVMVPILVLAAAGVAALVKPLDALLLGERYAASLGVDVRRARLLIIASAAVLAGAVTVFCGPIAFLGIAVPHLARTVTGDARHRVLLPAVVLIGAAVALVCDIMAQMPGSERTLPLNGVTSIVGAPIVIWLLIRRRPEVSA